MTDDLAAEAPRILCEGSEGPNHGYCQMCGAITDPRADSVPIHDRIDVLALLKDEARP